MQFPLLKSKKHTLLFLTLLIVVVIAIYYAMGGFKQFKTAEEETKWRTGQEVGVAEIIKAGDAKACDAVTYKGLDGTDFNSVCRNNIAYNSAIEKLDASYCAQLSPSFMDPKLCEEEILLQKLSAGNDPKVCDGASSDELKNNCLGKYLTDEAAKTADSSLCSKISNEAGKFLCLDGVAALPVLSQKNSLNCSGVPAAVRDDCNLLKSFQSKTGQGKDACYQIKNIAIQNRCLSGGQ